MRETLTEIVLYSVLAMVGGFIYLALTSNPRALRIDWESLVLAGEAVLGQIGWGLGTYVPIMLGFYAVIASGRLPGNDPVGDRTHRLMGVAAEALAASTVPLFLLVLVYCLSTPEKASVMLVVTPVMASIFLLAFMLGRFAGIPVSEQIRSVKRERGWVRARRAMAPPGSALSAWAGWAITSAAGTVVGMVVYFLAPPRGIHPRMTLAVAVLIFLLSCLASALALVCLDFWFSGHRSDAILGVCVYGILACLPVGFFVVTLFVGGADGSSDAWQDSRAGAIGVIAMCVPILLSALWPPRFMPIVLYQWTLQAAGARLARKSLDKSFDRASKRLEKLNLRS